MSGPFDRIGIDVIQFPKSRSGKHYAVVFIDYLTKWPEVFAVKDQTALTIATHFVEHIVARHGVPAQLLSDRGAAFLSSLMKEICSILGVKKINTTAYHPQTDGLVERFNHTLTNMLAKKVEADGQDWDKHLPYVPFAYRASLQNSTQESPFFLLYGRDPRLPSSLALEIDPNRDHVDLCAYSEEVATRFQQAWELAQQSICHAQKRQKQQFDCHSKPPNYRVGKRVFVYMPAGKQGKGHKFARPFHGPYRIVEVCETGASVHPIDDPGRDSIWVAFHRLRPCSEGNPNAFWPTKHIRTNQVATPSEQSCEVEDISVWSGRLRHHAVEDAYTKSGDL